MKKPNCLRSLGAVKFDRLAPETLSAVLRGQFFPCRSSDLISSHFFFWLILGVNIVYVNRFHTSDGHPSWFTFDTLFLNNAKQYGR